MVYFLWYRFRQELWAEVDLDSAVEEVSQYQVSVTIDWKTRVNGTPLTF